MFLPLWLVAILVCVFGEVVSAIMIGDPAKPRGAFFSGDLVKVILQVISLLGWIIVCLVLELVIALLHL